MYYRAGYGCRSCTLWTDCPACAAVVAEQARAACVEELAADREEAARYHRRPPFAWRSSEAVARHNRRVHAARAEGRITAADAERLSIRL